MNKDQKRVHEKAKLFKISHVQLRKIEVSNLDKDDEDIQDVPEYSSFPDFLKWFHLKFYHLRW